MSETWEATRTSWRRLKTALRDADEDARYGFAFWVISLSMMAGSIIAQFGWNGIIFCAGVVVWSASNRARSNQ